MSESGGFWNAETGPEGILSWILDVPDNRVNVLSKAVLEELERLVDMAASSPPKGIIIQSAKDSGFIAGADVNEFLGNLQALPDVSSHIRWTQGLFDKIDRLPCPVVAAINGFCLGGGLELALACSARVAVDEPQTRIGLPEVRLGIHPGYGGVARLPGQVGHIQAMNMMLSGRTVSARAAGRIGLVDYAVPRRQLIRAAEAIINGKQAKKRLVWWQRWAGWGPVRPLVAWVLRREVAKKASRDHYPAPYALIDLWQRHAGNHTRTLEGEAESVAGLLSGDTARNLIRVFFLQERLKAQGRDSDFRARHVHVIGAGVMGGDIAAWCALRGLRVTLQDQSPEQLAPAMKRAHALFARKLRRPMLVTDAKDRLIPDVSGQGVTRADVVIEAIFENVEAKQGLLKSVEQRLKPGALLATNTSSIPLETLAEVLEDPGRLVGLHFFNPVAKMQLVEVVQGQGSHQGVVNGAIRFARQIDRLPLPVQSTPGFLVNRILMPYLIEAVRIESEGVQVEAIDKTALDFGMPMGPIELADTVGLDICLSVADILSRSMGIEVPERLRHMVKEGRLGRKSGQGFYVYQKGHAVKTKGDKGLFVPEDVSDRLILSLINEAVACLREGVVADSDLLDAGIIFGTGFAPFRGGPIHHVSREGIHAIRARLEGLHSGYGDRFKPDPGWVELADRGEVSDEKN